MPLDRLLELAALHAANVDQLVEQAIDLFDDYVRKPRAEDDEGVRRVFERLLPRNRVSMPPSEAWLSYQGHDNQIPIGAYSPPFRDTFQALPEAALDADPYSPAGSGFFDSMRSWVHDRSAFVRGELGIAGPVEPPPGRGRPGRDLVLHVEELSGTGVAGRRGKRWEAIASVSVHDAEEARVDDVTVPVSWSTGQTGNCETVGGTCSVSLGLRGKVSSVNFSVDNLETTGSFYDASADHESGPVLISRP